MKKTALVLIAIAVLLAIPLANSESLKKEKDTLVIYEGIALTTAETQAAQEIVEKKRADTLTRAKEKFHCPVSRQPSSYPARTPGSAKTWDELILDTVNDPEFAGTGLKPEHLCILLMKESGGDPLTVGADGECGAFQTMPQFFKNYPKFCAYDSYNVVQKTCGREQWDSYPWNAYPKPELGYTDEDSCFAPENNIRAGAIEFSRKLKASSTVREALRKYNGSGPQAEAYADDAMAKLDSLYNRGYAVRTA